MCQLYLGEGNVRQEVDVEAALKTWASTKEGLMNFVNHADTDTYFVAALVLRLQMLPLTKVLTNIAGNSWARTLSGTRAERNEYILLHEFHRNKYICPDKYSSRLQRAEEKMQDGDDDDAGDKKKKDKFKGGLVFEPEKGLYDRFILVMDFNSLYPSIIQEYNICFTTVDRTSSVSIYSSRILVVTGLRLTSQFRPRMKMRRRFLRSPLQNKIKAFYHASFRLWSVVDVR